MEWLRSGSSYLIAWGAYFAGESTDEGVVTQMERLLERGWSSENQDQRVHLACKLPNDGALPDVFLLDALIQRNVIVPPEALQDAQHFFPFQTMILVSRLPIESSTPLLEKWYYEEEAHPTIPFAGGEFAWLRGRLAAMLLAKAPPSGFAASVLADSQDWLGVKVTNEWSLTGGTSPRPASSKIQCDDGTGLRRYEKLPPLMQYTIEENAAAKDDDPDHTRVLVETGGDRITFLVSPSDKPRYGDCPAPLTNENRYHLLMEMLGVDTKHMPWKPQQAVTIPWESKEKYLDTLRGYAEAEQDKLHAGMRLFVEKGLIDGGEVDTVRPKVGIATFDLRRAPPEDPKKHESPLPKLNDSHFLEFSVLTAVENTR